MLWSPLPVNQVCTLQIFFVYPETKQDAYNALNKPWRPIHSIGKGVKQLKQS